MLAFVSQSRSRPIKGFTLVEMLIVGSLIALFASLAVLNIREFYNSAQRKASIKESNSLGAALSMARDAIGFFPKLNYLAIPQALITKNNGDLRPDFDYIGFLNPGNQNDIFDRLQKRVIDNWQSMGYVGLSPVRQNAFQGRGGIVKVRLPSVAGQDEREDSLVDWPADPYGNPYVLYLLTVDRSVGGPVWRFVNSISEDPDFMVALVGYGMNGVPGSVWIKANPGDAWGAQGGRPSLAVTQELLDARLFRDGDDEGGPARFTMLGPAGYRIAANSDLRRRILKDLGTYGGIFPTGNLGGAAEDFEIRGIMDPGSDDVIYVF